jgi:hypothetical protein
VLYKQNENGIAYMRRDVGGLVWDNTVDTKTPLALAKEMNTSVTPYGEIACEHASHSRFIFSMTELEGNRDYVKLATKGEEVNLFCVLNPNELAKLIDHLDQFGGEQFFCRGARHESLHVVQRSVSLMCMKYADDAKTKGVVHVMHAVNSLEHVHDNNRSRMIVNSDGALLLYDGVDDRWILTSLDKDTSGEDVERYIEDRMWSGDAEAAEVDRPVIVCGMESCDFTSADDLTEKKKRELGDISNDNSVCILSPLVSGRGALFKHANRVRLQCVSANESAVLTYMETTPMLVGDDVTPQSLSEDTLSINRP